MKEQNVYIVTLLYSDNLDSKETEEVRVVVRSKTKEEANEIARSFLQNNHPEIDDSKFRRWGTIQGHESIDQEVPRKL